MAGYVVDTAALPPAAALDAAAAGHARVAVAQVRAAGADLFGAAWRGPAATAFRFDWQRWLAATDDLLVALDELSGRVVGAADGYAQTEAGVRAAVIATDG